MKKQDLNRKFDEHVINAMQEGFTLCLNDLTGSYSGVMGTQACFAKGSERIIMWMEEEHDYNEGIVTVHCYVARIELAEGQDLRFNYTWPSDWKEHLVSDECVYTRSSWWNDPWYFDTRDEAITASNLHVERAMARSVASIREVELTDKLLSIVRRIKGFKTVDSRYIRVLRSNAHKAWEIQNTRSGYSVTLKA